MLTCPKLSSGCILTTLYYTQLPFKSGLLNCSFISLFFSSELQQMFPIIQLSNISKYISIVVLQYDFIVSVSEVSAGLLLISVLLLSRAASWCARTYLYTTHYTLSKLLTKAYQLGVMEQQLILSLQWFLIFNLQEIRASPMHTSVLLHYSVCKQTDHLFINYLAE